jgi:type I restriction enzyme, R subunit
VAVTGINSEDRLVQAAFAAHLKDKLGWESVYAWNEETFGPGGMLGRASTNEVVLTRDLREALARLNPDLLPVAIEDALKALTVHDFSRSMLQHNQDFARLIRNGVPVHYRDASDRLREARAKVFDFDNQRGANRFLAVRE